MLTEQELLRFKELDDLKKQKRLSGKDFSEWKSLLAKGKDQKFGVKKPGNDISWWNKYPRLLKDASNIVFNEIAGTPFDTGSPVNAVGAGRNLPVGMRIEFLPTIGKAVDENSAYNYQMRDLWLTMHRKYRGIGTYESSDLGIAVFCIINLIRDVSRAERVYGVCSSFNARNRSTPSVLLRALGVEPDAYTGDELADFRYQLNRLILSAHRLCLPKGFSMLEAFVSANGLVFKDSESVRAQWFIYDSPVRVQFSGTAISTGSCALYLQRKSTGSSGLQTFQDIIDDLTADINALLNDTDIARMCSDILAAFGESGTVVLTEVPEDYRVEPQCDETRKLQFHNASVNGVLAGDGISSAIETQITTGSLDNRVIYQENNVIKQNLAIAGTGRHSDGTLYHSASLAATGDYTGKPVLNCWKDEVSDEDIIEMTRLTTPREEKSFTYENKTYYYTELVGYSIMVIEKVYVYKTDASFDILTKDTFSGNSATVLLAAILRVADLSMFDWHPIFFFNYTGTGSTPGYSCIFADLDNYTAVDKKALTRMHDACVLSACRLESSIVAD